MAASMVIGVYGAMIAYTLGVSESLVAIFGGPQWVWAVIFYAIMAGLLYGGLSILEKSEVWMELLKFGAFIVIVVLLFSSRYFSASKLIGFSWDTLLLPYGVVLFAFAGTAAIPEVREELKKFRLYTKQAIIVGSLIPIVVYALFTVAVVGTTGALTTDIASIGLAPLLGGFGFVLLHLFVILAMASSFVALGYALKESYSVDFHIPKWEAWALTMTIPVVFIAVGTRSFIDTLQVAGVFAGGIAGITVVLMHSAARRRSERKPEYQIKLNWFVYGALIALFCVGMLYELFLLF